MALIYQKTESDKCLILDPRQAYRRKIAFDSNWTEARLGVWWSFTTASNDNATQTDETVALASVYDLFCFGLKDSATDTLPGQANNAFWGVITKASSGTRMYYDTLSAFLNLDTSAGFKSCFGCGNGTTVNRVDGDVELSGKQCMQATITPAESTNYAAFAGLRIVIANRGTSSQQVTFTLANTTVPLRTGTPTLSSLRTALNQFASAGTPKTVIANDGATAFPVPDAFFIRAPFINNRLRIHAMMAVQVAP